MTNLLTIKNLSIGFPYKDNPNWVVDNVNLHIEPGETLSLVGESGGGKTMIGLAIMQLLPLAARVKSDSEIYLENTEILQLSEARMQKIRGKKIAMIFQDAMTALNPVLTIQHQIEEVLKAHFKYTRTERKQKILQSLERVGISNPQQVQHSYPHQLSGGMRQRAMIAMALAGEPDLLIADEPTTAIDVTLQAQILKLLKQLQQQLGMSLLFITHDLGVVAQIADRVAVLQQGKLVEISSREEFFTAPKHAYSRKLFAALPPPLALTKPVKPPTANILTVENLKMYFPIKKGILQRTHGYIKAVDDISFNLEVGKSLALVGESGAGKTTAAKGILQLLQPTQGKIIFQGTELIPGKKQQLLQLRKHMQIVMQDPFAAMNPRMLIKDVIAEGMLAQKIGKDDAERQRITVDLLRLVGLPGSIQLRYPHEFSGGQKQRICIARSLALQPALLICDEPTSALDVSSQMQILELLRQLQEDLNLSYLLITHNFAVVSYLADSVAVMNRGKIVEYGTARDVLTAPQHPYTKELLAAVPKVPQIQM